MNWGCILSVNRKKPTKCEVSYLPWMKSLCKTGETASISYKQIWHGLFGGGAIGFFLAANVRMSNLLFALSLTGLAVVWQKKTGDM